MDEQEKREIRDRLAALERRVTELSAELASATAQLEGQRRQHDTMRGVVRCPGCGGRSILHISTIVDRDSGGQSPMAVTTKGLFNPKPVGRFECYVCSACGLCEWYVADPAEIDPEGENSRLLEVRDREVGPYR